MGQSSPKPFVPITQEPLLPPELEDMIFEHLESRVLMGRIQLVCKSWHYRAQALLKQRLVEALTVWVPPSQRRGRPKERGRGMDHRAKSTVHWRRQRTDPRI